MALGIILGGLSIASLVASWNGTTFVAIPATVIGAYRDLADTLSFYLIALPFGVELPRAVKDATLVWLVFSGSNLRVFSLSGRVAFGAMFHSVRNTALNVDYRLGLLKRSSALIAAFVFGPIGTAFLVISIAIQISDARSKIKERQIEKESRGFWGRQYDRVKDFSNYGWHISHDDIIAEFMDYRAIARRGLLTIFTVVVANPIVAVALLWWNSTEIERLASFA